MAGMSDRVDRILELLDVGDQHTTLGHYGFGPDTDAGQADELRRPQLEPWPFELRQEPAPLPDCVALFVDSVVLVVETLFDAFATAFAPVADALRPLTQQEDSNEPDT